MARISNVDGVLLLLRERLQRLETRSKSRTDKTGALRRTEENLGTPVGDALTRIRSLDPDEAGRALVTAVLAEKFGDEVVNDASFQAVVTRVDQLLRTDVQLAELFRLSLEQISASD